jgi:hypothetical protein
MNAGDFGWPLPGGFVSNVSLRNFVLSVPEASLKELLGLYEGRVLRCDAIGVTNCSEGAEVRVTDVVAVAKRRVVVESELTLALMPGQTEVFLEADLAPESLDPATQDGLQILRARGRLTTAPADATAIRMVKWTWRPNETVPGRLEAIPDRTWWPAVATVLSHPFSRDAAQTIHDLLGESAWLAGFTIAAALEGELVSWPALLRDVLAECVSRWREMPQRLTELAALTRNADLADVVWGVIRLLTTEQLLAPTICIDGTRFRLAKVLKSVQPTQQFGDSGSALTLDCGPAPVSGKLAVALNGAAGSYFRTVVTTGNHSTSRADPSPWSAIRLAGAGTEPVVDVKQGDPVTLTVQGYRTTPIAVGVGIYVREGTWTEA